MKRPVEAMLPAELAELVDTSPDPTAFDETPMRAAAADSRPLTRGARVELVDQVDIAVDFFADVARVIEEADNELEALGTVDLDAVAMLIAERIRPSLEIVRTLRRVIGSTEPGQ